jgi:protein-S-isoprenylcysteine O-methyltransferase Ste14
MHTDHTAAVARKSPGRLSQFALSILRAGSMALVAGLFALLFLRCAQGFMRTGALDLLGLTVVNGLFVCLYVSRKDATAISTTPTAWSVSLGGTLLPLLMRPSSVDGLTQLGQCVQLAGIAIIAAAVLSLWRSFGIVPANRGVRENGLYRFVRHPLYAGEITFITGFVLAHPSASNIAVWAADILLQLWRARLEERFLSADPVYCAYCQRTRYRLVPLVY